MAQNKFEIKIIKDSKKKDAELDSMSLEVANAFLILLESITKIVELTPDNKNLKIQVKKGSVAVSVNGSSVSKIEQNFDYVINNKSENKELVEQWRNIQSLFSSNGLQYDAVIYSKSKKTSVFNILKTTKRLRAKQSKNPPITTNVDFMEGKLLAVGGKIPNIHLERPGEEKKIIACTEENAKKAINFLYSNILISVWVKHRKKGIEYELCDSYVSEQNKLVSDFKIFIDKFQNASDEIESLQMLHYECRKYLDAKDYGNFKKFLRLFNHEFFDVNTLNTILMITQDFRNSTELKPLLDGIEKKFEEKIIIYRKQQKRGYRF